MFRKSYDTFYTELFDTLLGIHTWPEYKLQNNHSVLSVDDIDRVIDFYIEANTCAQENMNYMAIRRMLWETRYGYANDFPIIARFFNCITADDYTSFTTGLFKLLAAPSLYYGKQVYLVHSSLLEILKSFATSQGNGQNRIGIDIIRTCINSWRFDNMNISQIVKCACDYQITGTPKWKNLLCRLIELLKTSTLDKTKYTYLFDSWVEIEHIQCYTDEDNPQEILKIWGGEINKIGNLVILEGPLNRSIKNHKNKKKECYASSVFASVRELVDKVEQWDYDNAMQRKKDLSTLLTNYFKDL